VYSQVTLRILGLGILRIYMVADLRQASEWRL